MADNSKAVPADDAGAEDVTVLERRIAELEAENARLAADAGRPAAVEKERRYPRGSWWRAVLSAICITLATILVPVSVVGAWARAELVNEDQFVATLGPLAADPAVQNMVIDETMTAIEQKVDFQQITSNVIDGVAGLNGMPPRAAQALDLLKAPAASGLQNLVETGVTKVVQSDQFTDVWNTAVRSAHRALTAVATADNTGAFVLTDKGLGLNLGPIVDQVKQKLVAQGIGVANMIPTVDKVIIIGDGSAVTTIQTVYSLAVTAGYWLPFVTLALFLLGILLARRRSVAVVGSGIGLFVGAGALAISFQIGDSVVGVAASRLKVSASGLDVVYQALVKDMLHTATIGAVLGLFIAVIGWALGSWSSSRRMRGLVGGLNSSARTSLAARGMNTGRFGEGLFRFRTLIHVLAVVAAVVWLLALRPLSFGDIVLVIVVVLLITWVIELLQKRPDEVPAPSAEPVDEHPGDTAIEPEAEPGSDGDTAPLPADEDATATEPLGRR
ncbi:hypothetical protein [Microbacterium mangrovi]|uniref:hypothetical protein n=1 Tax=Microbacterium mangrovi TaxID=1348253 RepID=UPI000A4890E5|nr:hypothetical protein [Microbacterium mangrovi]